LPNLYEIRSDIYTNAGDYFKKNNFKQVSETDIRDFRKAINFGNGLYEVVTEDWVDMLKVCFALS
jgi:hypothetical protein